MTTTMAHRGPIEDGTWPERLQGHVVDPGPPVRVHGYAAVEDLARHHGFAELTLLAFTGELPSSERVVMCELAWSLLAPIDVGASPTHAALLARMLVAPAASVVALAAATVSEEAAALLEQHGPWLRRCSELLRVDPATREGDAVLVATMRARLGDSSATLPWLREAASAEAAALALLQACGLREPLQLIAVVVQARLPCVIAEAERHVPRRLSHYPIQQPPFDYVEADDDDGGAP